MSTWTCFRVLYLFDKKSSGSGVKSKIIWNQQLPEELHKPIIKKFENREAYSSFKDNIRGSDLADMQLISKFNKEFRFSLCVVDIYSKYAWDFPMKDRKGITITNGFQDILDESRRKPKKYG